MTLLTHAIDVEGDGSLQSGESLTVIPLPYCRLYRHAGGHTPDAVAGALDEQRAAHLAQAHATVRVCTAAAHFRRGEEAQHLLDAFPAPARSLTVSGSAAAWRRASTTAQDTIEDLTAQRAATTEDGADSFADPELLHAQISYLAAREGLLHRLDDALRLCS